MVIGAGAQDGAVLAVSGPARRRISAALAVAVLGLAMMVAVAGPARAGAAEDILARINADRASEGLGPVRLNSSLNAVAAAWSQHMVDTQVMEHNPDMANQIPSGWSSAAENVAWNQPANVTGLHVQWMDSPPHRVNILNGAFTDVGIGVVVQDGKAWGTEVFAAYGAPAPAQAQTQPAPPPAARQAPPAPAPAPALEPAPEAAPEPAAPAPEPPAEPTPTPVPTPTTTPARPPTPVATAQAAMSESVEPPHDPAGPGPVAGGLAALVAGGASLLLLRRRNAATAPEGGTLAP